MFFFRRNVRKMIFRIFWPLGFHRTGLCMFFFSHRRRGPEHPKAIQNMFFGAAGEVQNIQRWKKLIFPMKNWIFSLRIGISQDPEAEECSLPPGRHPLILGHDPHGQAVNVFFFADPARFPRPGRECFFFAGHLRKMIFRMIWALRKKTCSCEKKFSCCWNPWW